MGAAINERGWDVLKPLLAEVEARYSQRHVLLIRIKSSQKTGMIMSCT
ncbi:hypothetical protein [Endozoicomonas sp.]|nr:hypothetical protein [Endozoicomonas sp.]